VNPRDKHEWFSARAARSKVKRDKTIKAAVWKGRPPITDDPFAKLRLFDLIKDADAFIRDHRDLLLAQGYEIEQGTLGAGLLIFTKGNERIGLLLDKRR
jgi:hypothetical protein